MYRLRPAPRAHERALTMHVYFPMNSRRRRQEWLSIFDYAPRGYRVVKSEGTAAFEVGENKGVYHFVAPHLRGLHQPPGGAERILALGASITFGFGLPDQDTYIARLQERLDAVFGADRIALLNAGIPGSGTAEHLAFLEDFGDEIAPAAVVVFVSNGDFDRAQRSFLYHLRSDQTLDLVAGSKPTNKIKRIIANADVRNFAFRLKHLAKLIRTIHLVLRSADAHLRPIDDGFTEPQQRLVRAIFRRMKAWCDARGIKLAVINDGWRRYAWLAELLASERIAAFDAAPQIQPHIARNDASYVIAGDGHPNAAGATLIANAVWPFVRNFVNEHGLSAGDDPLISSDVGLRAGGPDRL